MQFLSLLEDGGQESGDILPLWFSFLLLVGGIGGDSFVFFKLLNDKLSCRLTLLKYVASFSYLITILTGGTLERLIRYFFCFHRLQINWKGWVSSYVSSGDTLLLERIIQWIEWIFDGCLKLLPVTTTCSWFSFLFILSWDFLDPPPWLLEVIMLQFLPLNPNVSPILDVRTCIIY